MSATTMPVNTAVRFRTTRTVRVRDVTVSVTASGIERNLKLINVKIAEWHRDDTGIHRA